VDEVTYREAIREMLNRQVTGLSPAERDAVIEEEFADWESRTGRTVIVDLTPPKTGTEVPYPRWLSCLFCSTIVLTALALTTIQWPGVLEYDPSMLVRALLGVLAVVSWLSWIYFNRQWGLANGLKT
jgi:hypothetical protein